MPNVNIPEKENIKLVWTLSGEEDNLPRKMMDMVVPGKRRRGWPRQRWIGNTREDLNAYEMTTDMTESRKYWKMMVKTGPQRCGDIIIIMAGMAVFFTWLATS